MLLSIGVEDRQIFNSINPHVNLDILCTSEFWILLEERFNSPRNITFDKHIFLLPIQLRGETVENFNWKITRKLRI